MKVSLSAMAAANMRWPGNSRLSPRVRPSTPRRNPGRASCDNVPTRDGNSPAREVRQGERRRVRRHRPEDPLAAGLTDLLQDAGVKVFGPSKRAAQIEGDKWFAKEIMRHQAVPDRGGAELHRRQCC